MQSMLTPVLLVDGSQDGLHEKFDSLPAIVRRVLEGGGHPWYEQGKYERMVDSIQPEHSICCEPVVERREMLSNAYNTHQAIT
jgi:hypothetical protein